MPGQNEDRYHDIMKRIAERRPFGGRTRQQQPQTPHDRALDLLNVYDSLAELTTREYAGFLCYGPKYQRGRAWAGVVIWRHRKGYHGYQVLRLLGVWAHYVDDALTLSIGGRDLPYRAPVYDAGVFRVAIANGFELYYDDKGRPPQAGESLSYRAAFDLDERLTQRQALAEIVAEWREKMDAG